GELRPGSPHLSLTNACGRKIAGGRIFLSDQILHQGAPLWEIVPEHDLDVLKPVRKILGDRLLLQWVPEIDFVNPTEDALELSLKLARAGVDETGQLSDNLRFCLRKRSALETGDPGLGLHPEHRFSQLDALVQSIDTTCQD